MDFMEIPPFFIFKQQYSKDSGKIQCIFPKLMGSKPVVVPERLQTQFARQLEQRIGKHLLKGKIVGIGNVAVKISHDAVQL